MNRKRFNVPSLTSVVIIGILLFISGANSVLAEKSNQWAPDQRVPGYPDYVFTPYLLADQNRTVHAFSSQWVGETSRQYAVVYRQWSLLRGWTKPVDILLSPDGEAEIQGAFLDASGIIHVIFWGGSSSDASIYYSKAPVADADVSSAWSLPLAIGVSASQPISAAFDGDDKGNLVVIYNGNVDGTGVYEIHSNDSGNAWSKARSIFQPTDTGLVPYSLRLDMGRTGYLHAAWNVVTDVGVDMSLHYARYDVNENQWSEPVTLDKRITDAAGDFGPSFPSIVDNGENVVIIYNNGNPLGNRQVQPGRPVQMVAVSQDGGQTWNQPVVPFYRHLGRSGEQTLVVDGNNIVHTLFIQRIEDLSDGYRSISGVWHSELLNGVWSDPDRLVTTLSPHDVRAVVCQGNLLLAVWREDPGGKKQHGIWFSYTILDVPESPIVIPPTLAFNDSMTPNTDFASSSTAVAVSPTAIREISLDSLPTGFTGNPAEPLIIALLLVLLALVGVILIYQVYRNRNS